MKLSATLFLASCLTLTGCSLALDATTSDPPATTPVLTNQSTPAASSGPIQPPASIPGPKPASVPDPATTPISTYPARGILSDPAESSPGNPRTHARAPVARDLDRLMDKTRTDNERFRGIFQEHLKVNYPEFDFRVIDIMEYQQEGKTFRQARAYAKQSLDIVLFLYYDGRQIFDSFHRDVVERRNTMNRWRWEFRDLLDPISQAIIPLAEANFDVSYDYYPENLNNLRLDQALEPASRDQRKALELYFERPSSDPIRLTVTIAALFQAVQTDGYVFDEYYVHIRDGGGYTSFLVPPGLISTPQLPIELQAAIGGTSPGQIKAVPKPRP